MDDFPHVLLLQYYNTKSPYVKYKFGIFIDFFS